MADLVFDKENRLWVLRGVTWESAGKTRRGSFHKWVEIAGRIYAIVELEDGTMTTVRMRDIKFNYPLEESRKYEDLIEEGKENEE